ncbi:hypothetical protein R83H12_01683 [Fibrobacteria bacterium R8-3-H12]
MKNLSNFLVFAMSITLLACSGTDSSSVAGMPVRSSKVVSYMKGVPFTVCNMAKPADSPEKDLLKLAFPHIIDTEQEREECKYFVICLPNSSISSYYWLLSEDMTIYLITPEMSCGGTDDGFFNAMLVCDDTAEGNLEDIVNSINERIISNPVDLAPSYTSPNLTCSEVNEDVFF